MAEDQKLTKKEKKELRKLEWQEKARLEERNAKIKKYSIWGAVVAVIVLATIGLIMLVNSSSPTPTNQTVNIAPVSEKDITKGKKDAKVTVVEYADFQCPACASYDAMVNQLLSDYNDKILYVYRMFPLTNIHPNSHISAQAAYAAYKQGKFFEMDDYLYQNQTDWANISDPRSIFMDYAKKLKLDLKKFETEMNSDEAKKFVNNAESEALSEGMNSTPTFVVNGVKIQNPATYEDFKKIIDNESR